ncbi:mitochondrial import receptor subunit TOM70 isoform X2 [Anolis carolinensis]|uniref:mitochondrial import receptor subunit TOM70 isoform X2 n=1 Tax=Anolis carolinensis TaxID=28377 RepID=UPI002F2B8230
MDRSTKQHVFRLEPQASFTDVYDMADFCLPPLRPAGKPPTIVTLNLPPVKMSTRHTQASSSAAASGPAHLIRGPNKYATPHAPVASSGTIFLPPLIVSGKKAGGKCNVLPPLNAAGKQADATQEGLYLQSPLDRAQAAKNKGNKYFKAGKYEQAIQCYTEAIGLCPPEKNSDLSTFYQNRAAAYEQLQKWKEVAQDCTKAVELNPRYVKALFRRAKAHEKLDNKKECLEDVTAVCILEGFQNQQSMLLADKVLKLLGKEKAKEKYKNREPLMPSPQFIKSYFSSFTDDIISQPLLKGEKSDEDKDKEGEASVVKENCGYLKAKKYMDEENYDKIISECTKEIEAKGKYMAEALLLRATFYLLIGNANAAKPDLNQVISMEDANVKLRANALIKRGSMYMQQQQPMLSTQDFNMAADIDPQNADVYHHRGQLKILLDQVEEAVEDFDECIRLRPDSALAQAQKCFALYRQAYTGSNSLQVQAAMKGFEDVIKKFPRCAEGYALYAQALTDQQQFGKADEMYDKCIDLEPDNATTYVHKGLLQLQWKQDLDKGLELISKAIEIDNKCDFAYETMGTIEVQRGNLDKAIEMFNKAINLAKSETEMAHLYSLCDAAYAQTEVAKKYGLKPPTL